MSLFKVLTEALNHFIENGYDSQSALEDWLRKLKDASIDALTTPKQLQALLEKSLRQTFTRLVDTNSLVNTNISRYDINRIKPTLRAELDRRILASANLIKLNREEAINKTLRRFSGWATSIPIGGTKSVDKVEEKKAIRKEISTLKFRERRVMIDQTHKLVASINDIVAVDNGAIAAKWHSHWRQTDYNYRKDHKERDDKIYIIRDSWANKEHYVKAPYGYTDDITTPGEEVFCFPGDSEIPFAEGITKCYRRWYEGKLSFIVTASGTRLRGTPNHPILTDKGWVPMGSLNKGDYVVEISHELLESFKKNQNDSISTISEIFTSFQKNGVMKSFNLRPTDFHGDGSDGNVDIVFPAGELSLGIDSFSSESGNNLNFSKAGISTSTISSFNECFNSLSFPPDSVMSGRNSEGTLPLGHLSHTNDIGLTTSSDLNIGFLESFNNESSRDIEFLRNLKDTHSTSIQFNKIIDVDIRGFSGHVYNLETINHWYVASTIITHNCRCYYQYLYTLRALPDEMLTEKALAKRQTIDK